MERLGLKNLTLTNLCEGRVWRANFFALKYTALRHWLLTRTAAPEDLVLVLDADVIANSAQLSESDLSGRFEDVRGSHRIIFQAEPTCWAEFGASRAVFQSHGCSRHVLAGWGSVAGTHSRNYRCGRFLCGGAFAGFAADLVHLVERMEELRRGSHTELRLENARSRTARHRMCYFEAGERKLSDQCLATHVLLRSPGWVGLDYREGLFAYAAHVAASPREPHSIAVAPCGNRTGCRVSSTFDWTRRVPSDSWERPQTKQHLCGLRDGGPAFIHFNGAIKRNTTSTTLLATFL
eukprot:jgi/Chrpa1/17609/Chrysochromulina_OHIO_Genome00022494-RA